MTFRSPHDARVRAASSLLQGNLVNTEWPMENWQTVKFTNNWMQENITFIFMSKHWIHFQILQYNFSFPCSYSINIESLLKQTLYPNHQVIFNNIFKRKNTMLYRPFFNCLIYLVRFKLNKNCLIISWFIYLKIKVLPT